MRKKLLIIGASGHGKVCADIAKAMKQWDEIAFLDDDDESLKESLGFKVIGKSNQLHNFIDEYDFFVGIGNNFIRERIYNSLTSLNTSIISLIHPSSIIGSDVRIGKGSVVMAGVVINCATHIKDGCIINTSSSIDHDCVIEDFVHVSPGVNVAGNVIVGKKCWIGIGASVINNIRICEDCTIGAGGIVIKNIKKEGTFVGLPVKRI